MPKQVNPRRAKIHHTHSVSEWAEILGVHEYTIRRWIKTEALQAIIDHRPVLIRGGDLRTFLDEKNKRNRIKCGRGQMPCFGCKKGRAPASGMLDYFPQNTASGRLQGICGECETLMNRNTRKNDIERLFPDCNVTIQKCPNTLSGDAEHLLNVDFKAPARPGGNEQSKIIKFTEKRSA